ADPACRFLLCDAALEESHGLHFARGLVCADLPFEPMRLERRLGRFDRVDRLDDVATTVLLTHADPALALDSAWLRVLCDGFGLFAGSLADLHRLAAEE